MSRQSSMDSCGAMEDAFTLDDVALPHLNRKSEDITLPMDGEYVPNHKQKPSMVKRETFTTGGCLKNKDMRTAIAIAENKEAKTKNRKAHDAKYREKKAKKERADGVPKLERGRPPIPVEEAAKRQEEQKLIDERVRKSKETAERLIREAVAHALFNIEQDFVKEFAKSTKVMRLALITAIRQGSHRAVDEAVEKIQRSTTKQV